MDAVSTRAAQLAIFGDAAAATKTLADTQIVLFSTAITPSRDTVLADLDIVTVAGLAAQTTIDWGPAYQDGDGLVKISASIVPFVATTLVGLPLSLFGWAVLDTAGTGLLGCALFDDPIPCTQIGDGVAFTPVLPWGN